MKAQIVQIGNSQGLRIPKILLEESGIRGEVELEICAEGILIRNISKPRSDWDAKFRSLADHDDDFTVSEVPSSQFEVHLVNLDPEVSDDPKNTRPCVVISPDEVNRNLTSVIIAPLASTINEYP